MLGSDLRPEDLGHKPVAQIISLAEVRRGRAEAAHQAAQRFRVGDKVVSSVELARGCAETGLIASLPSAPHGRAIVQFNGTRRALYLSELQRVPAVERPCDSEDATACATPNGEGRP